jgi:outer membrane lipoprotein SlyB
MKNRVRAFVFVLVALCPLGASQALAQSSSEYSRCVALAEQQSGFNVPNQSRNAPLRGAAAGAAGGAFIGGITGGSAGTGAAIGAAFGAIAGGVRQQQAAQRQRDAENSFNNYFNACMSQPPH